MPTNLPQRPRAHQLEAESIRFFQQHLPVGWTCDKPQNDYGVDLRIGLSENGRVTGQAFVVQLKGSDTAPEGETVAVRLNVATLNYLRQLLEVAVLAKYVANERQAYWLLLKDAPRPKEGQLTITIRIPRANTLGKAPWAHISEYVRKVHYRKLGAMITPKAAA